MPKNIKDVHRFLGFTGYYRMFIQVFSTTASPLNELLVGHVTNPKAKKKSAKNEEKSNTLALKQLLTS